MWLFCLFVFQVKAQNVPFVWSDTDESAHCYNEPHKRDVHNIMFVLSSVL